MRTRYVNNPSVRQHLSRALIAYRDKREQSSWYWLMRAFMWHWREDKPDMLDL